MGGRMGLIGFLIVVVSLLQGANAVTVHLVGESMGWTIPPSNSTGFYENWASNKTFLIGDALEFQWNGTHTVTEVANKEEYDDCEKTGIVIEQRGVVIPLLANGTRYFLCSVGTHCEQGMKMAITVGNGIAPPPPSAAPSLSASGFGYFFALLSTLGIFLFNYI